ncbi:MAG: isoprenylcysteine carboxylmethyltransferase family protein [Clostridia bacterium]|nr:isoprenylcysteine carboxylmethyltransferase family protein [Clostridia bacterium]
MKLLCNALIKLLCGLLLISLLIFLPAGTVHYFNGWLLLGVLFVPILILGVVLLIKSPDLLAKRLDLREKQSAQKRVVSLSALLFLLGFIAAGLDFRFGWTHVPFPVVLFASAVFLCSYGLYAEVMRENAYLSRTVKVEEGQRVIDTGLYGVVRHPMYFATVLLFLAMPLILGSWISFLIFLAYPVLIALRIQDEERLLERELTGYTEYKARVKYRLIPFVW